MLKSRTTLMAAIAMTLSLAGCQRATPTPTPAELLAQGAQDLQSLSSFKFTLAREGEPVIMDPTLGLKFVEAAGEYQAPDKVHAAIKVQLTSTVLNVEMLWLPEGVYATNPLTGKYAPADPPPPFNAAALFGADGLPGVLQTGVTNVTLAGQETPDDLGVETYHLRAEADGAALQALTGGVLVEGVHLLDVWMEVATSHLLRLHDTEPGGEGQNGWLLDLSGFNEPVEIKAP
jgi:hypothetical protein